MSWDIKEAGPPGHLEGFIFLLGRPTGASLSYYQLHPDSSELHQGLTFMCSSLSPFLLSSLPPFLPFFFLPSINVYGVLSRSQFQ